MHGYDVARAVEATTNGCCSPAEGTIYPVLREFEEGGYVTAASEVVSGASARSTPSRTRAAPPSRWRWRPGWT
nr:PadR family transcriptional regulator [Xanthobacter flavus]